MAELNIQWTAGRSLCAILVCLLVAAGLLLVINDRHHSKLDSRTSVVLRGLYVMPRPKLFEQQISNVQNMEEFEVAIKNIRRRRTVGVLGDEKSLGNQTNTSSPVMPVPSSNSSTTAESVHSNSTHMPFNTTDLFSSNFSFIDTLNNTDLLNNTSLLNDTNSLAEGNETLSLNQTGLQVEPDGVPRFLTSEVFLISIIVGICLLITLISVTTFLCYRRTHRPENTPASQRLSKLSCNGSTSHDDAVTLSYINAQFDQKFLQDNPEEMQSLENDTFLNSLESMMFVNQWTESAGNSQLNSSTTKL